MSHSTRMSAHEWRELTDLAECSIAEPESVLEQLTRAYDNAAVRDAEAIAGRLLLPLPNRPRVSPSSLRVIHAAHDFGCFFRTAPLRDDLRPPVASDQRWQSGYIQQHMVLDSAAHGDPNVEIHDLVHAMYGVMWWPEINTHEFYLASRLSEATAAFHYYFMDQFLEPRCPLHERVVDLGRIWKFNVCPDCNREENRYYNLPATRKSVAHATALECARQARAFFLAELRGVAREAVEGIRFVARNPVNLSGNAADALRYAHYTLPFLQHPRLQWYMGAMQEWQVSKSPAAYVHKALAIFDVVNGYGPDAGQSSTAADLAYRRRVAVGQDLLLRLGTVLAQSDRGERPLSPGVTEVLEECVSRIPALISPGGGTSQALSQVFATLNEAISPGGHDNAVGRMVATVGYEPEMALMAITDDIPRDAGTRPDRTHTMPALEARMRRHLPRTMKYLTATGVLTQVLSAFRAGPERFARVESVKGDGRVPDDDNLIQRFLLLLARLSCGPAPESSAAALAHQIASVEHGYLRYQVQAKADLDLRDPAVQGHLSGMDVVRLSASAQFVDATVDIEQAARMTRSGDHPTGKNGDFCYIFSLTRGRTYLSRLPAPIGDALRCGAAEPVRVEELMSTLTRQGLDTGETGRLIRQWLGTGVVLPLGRLHSGAEVRVGSEIGS